MGKNGKKETALARVDDAAPKFPVLAADGPGGKDVAEALKGATAFDLERVTIPAGGATSWAIETLTGSEQAVKLTGIIVGYQDCRAAWKGAYQGQQPPDCASEDGVVGVGDPGGQCATCPLAQFGSKEGTRGQACKAIRRLFLLRPGTFLPMLISLPPTSIKACRQYLVRVLNTGRPYWRVVTEIGLEKASNSAGISYSRASFHAAAVDGKVVELSAEEAERAKAFGAAVISALASTFAESFVVGGEEA